MTLLPLTGMHALADCTECHQRAFEGVWSPVPADCFACHARDYRRSDIHPLHVGSAGGGAALDRDCAACHRASAWTPAIIPVSAFTQALVGPELDHDRRFVISIGPHRGAPCGDCHLREDGRGPVSCTDCHVHDAVRLRAQHRQVVPTSGMACLGCHPGGVAR